MDSLLWDLNTIEELIKRRTTVVYFDFNRLTDVDYLSFLIENDLDIEQAFLEFEKKLLISLQIVKDREHLAPTAVLQFSARRSKGKEELEEQFIKLIKLDISKSFLFREDNIFEVVKNRELYRSRIDEVEAEKVNLKKKVDEVMEQLTHERHLITLNEQREALHHEITGVRYYVSKDEFDDAGNPKIIEDRVNRRTDLIPLYYTLIEEIKNHVYKNSNTKATAQNYLKSQKILENRIEIEKLEMLEKRKKFNESKD